MKRRSISTKLFLVTALFFIVLITSMMVLHTSFFESYYQWKKTSTLRDSLDKIKNQYIIEKQMNGENLSSGFEKFQKINGAAVIFINRKSDGTFQMKAPFNSDIKKKVVAIDNSGNTIALPDKFSEQLMESINYKPVLSLLEAWGKNPLVFNKLLALGTTSSFIGDPKSSLAGSVYAITPFQTKPGDETLLFAYTSLQPVGEAAEIVKDFYVYSYIFAILLIIFLTYIFSRMISKPLLKLNETASQMAKLDFSAQYISASNDEIGNLGKTLNFLSQNLNSTLHQLKAANEQLKLDIEKDKQLEKLRREFVAGVSHELKTPISLIYGYAEGLRDGIPQGERREEYLDVILQETEHMGKLVSDMLDLSQLESGQFTWIPAPFEITSSIRSTVDKLSVQMTEQKIHCQLSLPHDSVMVRGDLMRIEQVLKNLLSNAIRHTSPNGRIEINLARNMDSQEYVTVSIFNEGNPIPEEAISHIWDTFYKVDSSRNRELGGTGIGLSIVKNILSHHGNRFGVSNENGGVCFYFTLPLNQA
jgi:two-component system sensor histidine kinase VanS